MSRSWSLFALVVVAGCTGNTDGESGRFIATLTNTSSGIETSDGVVDVLFAPGVFCVGKDALFIPGAAATPELEQLAEDGKNGPMYETVLALDTVSRGVFGADDAGVTYGQAPIRPGSSVRFQFDAEEGTTLWFASMFIQSNDAFIGAAGIDPFTFAREIGDEGDATVMVALFDAGTEVDEEPGVGASQAPRQGEANTGAEEGDVVRRINGTSDGFAYPHMGDVLRFTISRTN